MHQPTVVTTAADEAHVPMLPQETYDAYIARLQTLVSEQICEAMVLADLALSELWDMRRWHGKTARNSLAFDRVLDIRLVLTDLAVERGVHVPTVADLFQ